MSKQTLIYLLFGFVLFIFVAFSILKPWDYLFPQHQEPAVTSIPTRDPSAKANLIDLSSFYNHGLHGSWVPLTSWPKEIQNLNHDLGSLPSGIQTLGNTQYDIRGIIQLSSQQMIGIGTDFPSEVKGIPVGQKFNQLHAVNGNHWGYDIPEGESVAYIDLHYEDDSFARLEMLSGKHTQDWWYYDSLENKATAPTVWEGTNELVLSDYVQKRFGNVKIRLYQATWDNPHPELSVRSLDIVSAMKIPAPFIVALTME